MKFTIPNNKDLGLYLQIGGCVLGTIVAITLISQHPLLIGLAIIGAGVYGYGAFLKKQP
jgi:CHASE2 domain-containing sensor protein